MQIGASVITPYPVRGFFTQFPWFSMWKFEVKSPFLYLQFTQRLNVCKSQLVVLGMEIFSRSFIIYSYLFVGVGLAQNFKPITIFTRDFLAQYIRELFQGKLCLIKLRQPEYFMYNFASYSVFLLLKYFSQLSKLFFLFLCLFIFFMKEHFCSLSYMHFVLCWLGDMMKIYVLLGFMCS